MCVVAALVAGTLVLAARPAYADADAAKVVGPERCAECHKPEYEAWKETHHYGTLNTMHRTPRAQGIAEKLGLKSIKRDSPCLGCHYTQQTKGGESEVIAGVSCEDCHGAARDWVDVHNDYGGKGATKEAESADHRRKRIEESIARGMKRPEHIYPVAANCFGCHNVPDEKLVNLGGHQPGSNFELVSWSQGEVRHNYLDGKTNAADSAERLRVMYVIGQAVALETNLRDLAKATEKAVFATSMARRVATAREALKKVDQAVAIPEVQQMLAVKAELKLGNQAELLRAADQVGVAARRFAQSADGAKLAAIDPLLPDPSRYKGKARP
jgi:hypothetical protein